MSQESDVGVGICGKEGMQAAMTADFSLAQFKHLDRLLFVHGTLSLFRLNKVILFMLYKNVMEACVLVVLSSLPFISLLSLHLFLLSLYLSHLSLCPSQSFSTPLIIIRQVY